MNKPMRFVSIIALFCILLLVGCGKQPIDQPSPPLPTKTETPTSPSTNLNTGIPNSSSEKELINKVMELAKQGKVIGCQSEAGKTNIEDVRQEWGKPEKTDYIPEAKGTYDSYSSRGFAFGFNKGLQIFDIRSYSSELKSITLSDVKNVLGPPDHTSTSNGQVIIGYVASPKFKLRLIFPQPIQQNPNPSLDHVSVFYPQGTVNSMAGDPGLEW